MKSPSLSQPRPNWLHRLIQDVTSAPAKDLARIENIMRDEVFHSTLDWQSREQLAVDARQAFVRPNEACELYDLDRSCRMAIAGRGRLKRPQHPPNRAVLADAGPKYKAARAKLSASLDETKTT